MSSEVCGVTFRHVGGSIAWKICDDFSDDFEAAFSNTYDIFYAFGTISYD